MKQNKNKALREGAMMVALTVVLILISLYVPFLSLPASFACGIPMAALAARSGLKAAAPAFFAVLLLAFFVTGNFYSAISVVLMSILPGLVCGAVLGKRKKFFFALFATCLAVCLGWLFELVIINSVMGNGIEKMFEESMNQIRSMLEQSVGIIEQSGLTSDSKTTAEMLDLMLETSMQMLRTYLPSFVVLFSMLEGYIIMRFCSFVIRRAKIAEVDRVLFSEMKAPRNMSFVAIICYVVYIFSTSGSVLNLTMANVVFVLYTIIGICGLSFVDYKMRERIKSAWGRAGIYAIVFLFGGFLVSFLLMGLIVVGIVDSGRNFRNLATSGGEL